MSTINITGDALPWLRKIDAEMRDHAPRIRNAMAVEAAKTVRTHFRSLSAQRHRGFTTRDFYGDAAGATTHNVTGDEIAVVVGGTGFSGRAIALRYHGGTVRPVKAKALTIPVKGSDAERTGRRASEYDDLFVVPLKDGVSGMLARTNAAGELEPLYWLRKSVTHKADPSVLPTAKQFGTAMSTAANRVVRRLKNQ